eukprot:7384414-Prymnesium_polylepis.2
MACVSFTWASGTLCASPPKPQRTSAAAEPASDGSADRVPKPAPTIVTTVPPVAIPDVGWTLLMTGCSYSRNGARSALNEPPTPPLSESVTFTSPAAAVAAAVTAQLRGAVLGKAGATKCDARFLADRPACEAHTGGAGCGMRHATYAGDRGGRDRRVISG